MLNHEPTERQLSDLSVFLRDQIEVVDPSEEIKLVWCNISPESDEYHRYLLAKDILKDILSKNADVVWAQGEGVTVYHLVEQLRKNEIEVVAATTKRKVIEEKLSDGSVKKTSVFDHCRFIRYWF